MIVIENASTKVVEFSNTNSASQPLVKISNVKGLRPNHDGSNGNGNNDNAIKQ